MGFHPRGRHRLVFVEAVPVALLVNLFFRLFSPTAALLPHALCQPAAAIVEVVLVVFPRLPWLTLPPVGWGRGLRRGNWLKLPSGA